MPSHRSDLFRPRVALVAVTCAWMLVPALLLAGCNPGGGPTTSGRAQTRAADNASSRSSGASSRGDAGGRGSSGRGGDSGGGGGWGGMRNRQTERPVPVEAAPVRVGRISRQLRSSGRLQPRAQATVTSGISGQLEQVSVEIGHSVVRQVGDHIGPYLTIARLSPAQLQRASRAPMRGGTASADGNDSDNNGGSRDIVAMTSNPPLPDGMTGFAGIVRGTVVEVNGTGLLLEVTDVPVSWPASRAFDPSSVVGRRVRVDVRWVPVAMDWQPSPVQLRWLSTVRPGQQVAVGARNDLLAVFDDEPFRLALQEAEATSRLRAEEVRQRTYARDKAQADLDRAYKAMRGDELDERIFTREQVDNLKLAVDTADVDLRVAELNLQQARLAEQRARRDLRSCFVTAPIDGVVVTRHVKAWDRVNSGDPLFDIADPHHLLVFLYLTEGEAADVAVGQGAMIASRGQQTFFYPAVVERVAPAVDQERGLVEVRLRVATWRKVQALSMWSRMQQMMRLVSGPAGMLPTFRQVGAGSTPPLQPGMFVSAQIATAVHENAVLCPKEALLYERDRPYVFRVTRDGRAERVWVRLRADFASWDDIEIESGLRVGDRVVVRQTDLKDGALVTVVERED